MPKHRNPLPDIYQTDAPDLERDFTPQVADNLLADRERELRRQRAIMILLGGLMIAAASGLVFVVARDYAERSAPFAPQEVRGEEPVLPLFTLPARGILIPAEGDGGMPASRVKDVAYQIVMGQRAMGINPQGAIGHFQEALRLFPDLLGVRRVLGTLYLQTGRPAEAVEHLERALDEEEQFETLLMLGEAAMAAGLQDRAEQVLLRAHVLRPENPVCHRHLAGLYRDSGRDEQAIFHYERYLELRPGDLETRRAYAGYLVRLERWEQAAGELSIMTEEEMATAPVWFLLAQALAQSGRSDEALEALEQAVGMVDPALALSWVRRAGFDPLRQTEGFRQIESRLQRR